MRRRSCVRIKRKLRIKLFCWFFNRVASDRTILFFIFSDTAVVITSRKGKEMLLYRSYTYRKQYVKGDKSRWVCSTLKNCRAVVFTDDNNAIVSIYENHKHDPPKYYLNPNHVLEALRQPLVFETD